MSGYEIVRIVSNPHRLLLMLALIGWIVAWWRLRGRPERRRLRWVAVPLLALATISWGPVRFVLIATLERQYPPPAAAPEGGDAVVVLAGGFLPAEGLRPRAELDAASLARCRHAAWIIRQGPPRPILVCGGANGPTRPADLMRELLLEWGLPAESVLVDRESLDTHQNAIQAARIARERGWARVVLVTDALHMPRAVGCFRKQALDVIPAPCRLLGEEFRYTITSFLPDPSREEGRLAVHEWIGLVWYKLRGRI